MNSSVDSNIRVTGTMFDYFHICRRKMWLFSKQMNMENISGNADVIKGKLLHETRFQRETRREISYDNSAFDFVKVKDQIVVHEIKKSKVFEEAHIWQLKFYIYQLREQGVPCRMGVMHYPTAMRKVDVDFTEADAEYIEQSQHEIRNILSKAYPPKKLERKRCTKCAYFDFCYV
ncbi:hypothetical protein SOV_42840 [Sporomusa ovata DSM 2662]|uniref:CRISPR-associated exonuclease Cas4 n=1 Tax=Sporomusa ovata TaxID=2378 RepID=A0A0U1KU42_9FIRM|nr:CRISPR-associated protein Cas4 [Sporomusa ovata]EQB26672.1 CRISPR-associated protein Cas4 [Sporomusa ovata DSM 2662]CQR70765.1 CRISPR-associated RecB family exonuclease Cas4a [Sporomusa ovata]